MFYQWSTREKKMLLLVIALVLVIVSTWFSSSSEDVETGFELQPIVEGSNGRSSENSNESHLSASPNDDHTQEAKAPKEIMVDVKGAVTHPNVYIMNEGERVIDAILKAGDLNENGTSRYMNLAQKLEDGMVIYIPTEEEVDSEQEASWFVSTQTNHSSSPSSGKININSASVTELESLPGIGPSRAEAIIAYREEKGEFTLIEEIMNISGIGPKIFEKLEELIEI
jgi:competence protein ComEA